jgi:hypothetical protein
MPNLSLSLHTFVLLLLASTSAAQAGPAVVRAKAPTAALNPPNTPGTIARSVYMHQLPGDPDGTYTIALSIPSLPAADGGVGERDILTGKYNELTNTFTKDLLGAQLNTSVRDFAFVFERTGTIGTLDRPTGPFLSVRPNVTSPWPAPTPITGISNTYVDPAPGYVGGQLMLFYVLGADIVMQPLDAQNSQVTATPILVVTNAGGQAHSPTPVYGPDGNVKALWFSIVVGGNDSDQFWKADLDPMTVPIKVVDTTTWLNNGAIGGGILYGTEVGAQVWDVGAAWMTGDTVQTGGTAMLWITAFQRARPLPVTSITFLSRGTISPLQVPGISGELGIDPTALLIAGVAAHNPNTGKAALNLPVPNDASLRGAAVPIQSLVVDIGQRTLDFTNTATIAIR